MSTKVKLLCGILLCAFGAGCLVSPVTERKERAEVSVAMEARVRDDGRIECRVYNKSFLDLVLVETGCVGPVMPSALEYRDADGRRCRKDYPVVRSLRAPVFLEFPSSTAHETTPVTVMCEAPPAGASPLAVEVEVKALAVSDLSDVCLTGFDSFVRDVPVMILKAEVEEDKKP